MTFGIANKVSLGVGVGVAIGSAFLGYWVVNWILSGLIGIEWLEWLEQILSFGFGIAGGAALAILLAVPGFQALPELSNSIISIAGYRLEKFVFSEGPAWRPPYIGKFLTESTQLITHDFAKIKCLSQENIGVEVDGSVQTRLNDINESLGVEAFATTLKQEYESALRFGVKQEGVEDVSGKKDDIAEMVRAALIANTQKMGHEIVSVRLTEVLPVQSFLDALEERKREDVQGGAEDKDTETLIRNFEKARKAMSGVPETEVLAALQARRGLSKNIQVTGGSPIERAAALVADGLSGGSKSTPDNTSPPSTNAGGTKPRRRGQY